MARLLIVSNRLPITVVEKESKHKILASVGGLVSGLSSFLQAFKNTAGFSGWDYIWIGWPGINAEGKARKKLKEKALSQFRAYPVFLAKNIVDRFYYGFCNKLIWPLFHYFTTYAVYYEEQWNAYKAGNEAFCDAILEILKPGDIVWVHDYHLMLLPKLLREKRPNLSIGFFLHIPFPSFEIFRMMPPRWAKEVLEGMLASDLLGFHTNEYKQNFLRSALRILGHDHQTGQITIGNRICRVDAFPMGIDTEKFKLAADNPETRKERHKLRSPLASIKTILSVDRLDYTKGIINRLQGFDVFLQNNSKWHRKVCFIMVVVPSRVGVDQYQQMKKQIEEIVGRINGKYGTIGWTPILYQYRSLSFPALAALYQESDVALITPLRDGMNLVAKEYVASRTNHNGVLVLSEAAGAAREMGEAVIVNPNHREDIAEAIDIALNMPQAEQSRRIRAMQERLDAYDVTRWAEDFTGTLLATREEQKRLSVKMLTPAVTNKVLQEYGRAKKRLVLLDYDGTLVPIADNPDLAKPTPRLIQTLKKLSVDPANVVVIISGRSRARLEGWFGELQVSIVAEHGVWLKHSDKSWRMIKPLSNEWKPAVTTIMSRYSHRVPGSFVEEKDYALAWHYRKADQDIASVRAKEMVDELVQLVANIDTQVIRGKKVVEVRCAGVNKGAGALRWLTRDRYEFILAVGDDRTDEDLFRVLPDYAVSIRVGLTPTFARYNILKSQEVVRLLERFTKKPRSKQPKSR